MSEYTVETVTSDCGTYRVRVVLDLDPQRPEDDGACPVLRIDPDGYGLAHTGYGWYGTDRDGLEQSAESVAQYFVDVFGWSRGLEVFDRYLRAFHGGRAEIITSPGTIEFGYLAYTTEHMAREAWGFTPENGHSTVPANRLIPEADEWVEYIEGNVYGLVPEHRTLTESTVFTWNGVEIAHHSEETWIEIDEDVWGFYGYEYALEAAMQMLLDIINRKEVV